MITWVALHKDKFDVPERFVYVLEFQYEERDMELDMKNLIWSSSWRTEYVVFDMWNTIWRTRHEELDMWNTTWKIRYGTRYEEVKYWTRFEEFDM